MEGVGARLGRSSSRYGTTTVFTGPVRKWKKDWVPINPPSSSNNSNNQNHNHQSSSSSSVVNGGSLNGNNNGSVSHLRLYKWTPISQSKENPSSNNNDDNNNNQNNNVGNSDNDSPTKENSKEDNVPEPPPKKKFKYIPIAVLEEQKKEVEAEESADDEAIPAGADENTADQASKTDGHGEKPDINDVPMEENQDAEENQTAPGRQDLNESLDLSLGLTSHEGQRDSGSKTDPTKEE